ncbi:RagB/SusD family nutrient uptake outer membrane protein [Daejeonella lutea]|uniref:Starch-binding associating with outer membrane n=1 Tax=Daejeonella lutea TaxID=572036 RepID=A0A1T5A6P3_9SPHI|nr:RagB/SusD family nutrient uptake outer membrane protein [Daejeonella lutea]SKB30661.1 Starch-binding associating with outer membrane [Daejeonella lutea]
MKTKHYIFAIVLLLSLGSCKKFLETEPTDFLNPDNYYETEAQLQFARAGAYSPLGANGLWGSWGNYLLGFSADEGYMNRATLTTGPWNYFYSTGDQYLTGMWLNLFNGINRVNVVLENLDKNPGIAQSKRDGIRGEMLFLRGYYYFTLAQYFGGVPIKTASTTSVVDVDIARNSLKEVYEQILKDMTAAEPMVPSIATLGYSGAINKSAVRGLLARVNLHMAGEPLKDKTRYAEAAKWAKMVIDDATAGHALNASYPQIFINLAQDKYDIKESLWEVEFWGNGTDQFVETTNNGWINGPTSANPVARADAYMSITSKFYDVFEPGDNRKFWNIPLFNYTGNVTPAVPAGTKTLIAEQTTGATKNTRTVGKYRREFETLLPRAATTTPQNVILLRFSDILLMWAEAQNEISGPTPEAIEAVNKIRRRGWSTGVKTITVTNGGAGYTTAPTVTFSAGVGGNTATGVATITAGRVTAITLNRDATGIKFNEEGDYATAPTITISGGGGSGATATATIHSKTDANLAASKTSSKAAFLTAIQDERYRELAFEGLRKGDLLRWGNFLSVYQDMGDRLQQDSPGAFYVNWYKNASAKDLLMPIPNSEMSTNLKMTQNPGW